MDEIIFLDEQCGDSTYDDLVNDEVLKRCNEEAGRA
jgi:hypothetical protein